MKILYITTSFDLKGNSASVRNSALVKGLLENGNIVDVLTIKYPENRISKILSQCACNVIRSNISITRKISETAKLQSKINNSIFRSFKQLLREFLFFPDVYTSWPKYINEKQYGGYDVIISSSDLKSSHFVALKIKKSYPDMKWIQIWGDPWSFDSTSTFITNYRAKYKECSLLNAANKIIYVSELTYLAILKKYPELSDKLFYIPRSYFHEIPRCTRSLKKSTYDIVYSGTLNSGRDFEFFLSEIDSYNQSHDTIFRVNFYGSFFEETIDKLRKYSCTSIHSTIDYDEILNLYAHSDALLFISNKRGSTQIPGKLFDYMGTELPIICLVNKEDDQLRQFLNKYPKCILFEENFMEMADVISKGQFEIEKRFSPQNIAKEVLL